MSNRWFWKPVMVGATVLALLGCFFGGFLLFFSAVLTCPGLEWACLSSTQEIFTDLLYFGCPPILIGGLTGAGLGALYAGIRRWIRKNRVKSKHSE